MPHTPDLPISLFHIIVAIFENILLSSYSTKPCNLIIDAICKNI